MVVSGTSKTPRPPTPATLQYPEVLSAARFYLGLFLDGSADPVDGYFMECRGFKCSQDVIEFSEVFPLSWGSSMSLASKGRVVRTKLPGNTKFDNITLRRGISTSRTLWQWLQDVRNGQWKDKRKDGYLVIYQQNGQEGARFWFERAWPVSYSVSDVNVTSGDLSLEDLELTCENFYRT